MYKKKIIQLTCLLMLFTGIILAPSIDKSTFNLYDSFFSQVSALPFDSSWEWVTTDVVSTESTAIAEFPVVDVDSNGNIHVMWQDSTDYDSCGTDIDIFYKRWNSSEEAWITTEVVSTESIDDSYYGYTPSMAVDSDGNVHFAWEDSTDYDSCGTDIDVFYKRWNASEDSWTTTEVVSTESTLGSWDPDIDVDGSGNVHIIWTDATNYGDSDSKDDIFYKKWVASTDTWGGTEMVSSESSDDAYLPALDVDSSGNAYIAWADVTDYLSSGDNWDIFYKKRSSTGSWSTTEVITTDGTLGGTHPDIAVDLSGKIHIVYYASTGSDNDILHRVWTTSWSSQTIVSSSSTGSSWYPAIDTDDDGNIHVSWSDSTNDLVGSGSDRDIFYQRWNVSTTTWMPTELVSTVSTGGSDYPSIYVDGNYNIHVVWQDNTNYEGAEGDLDIFYLRYTEVDSTPPAISSVSHTPLSPTELDSVNISAEITDDVGIDSATLYY
ncbi:MAG: hypothetical protein H7641_10040, partial [Candidatus Heimdallarchaeota archaeon]|nr:hypothetical protein [Candidatus Heimdallarchaeota archaeon]MCK4877902.1 hypothetical protein [Candidatus Heimdallarchaeota archaeon]